MLKRFEYMSKEETKECEELILNNTNNHATIVFWNMMVERSFTNDAFKIIDSDQAFIKERPFFYKALRRYEKYESNR